MGTHCVLTAAWGGSPCWLTAETEGRRAVSEPELGDGCPPAPQRVAPVGCAPPPQHGPVFALHPLSQALPPTGPSEARPRRRGAVGLHREGREGLVHTPNHTPTRTSPGRPCTDPNTTPHCASDTSPPSESQTLSAWSEHRGFRAPEVSGQAGPVDTYVWSACRGHAGPASCPPRLTPGGARGVSNVWESANPSPTEASPPDRFVSSSGFSPKLKRVLHDPQIIKNRSIKVVFLLKGKGASMLACASGPP